jgi:hypothetical protein
MCLGHFAAIIHAHEVWEFQNHLILMGKLLSAKQADILYLTVN